MIYPTRLAVLLAAGIAPLALLLALLFPAFWTAGLGLVLLLVVVGVVDARIGGRPRDASVTIEAPGAVGVTETFAVLIDLAFRNYAPRAAEVALGTSGPVAAPMGWTARAEMEPSGGKAAIPLRAERRGTAVIDGVWLRWKGAFGLVWKQRYVAFDRAVLISPDIRPVREQAPRLINRDALHGMIAQMQVGEGAEFEALADYRQGMDRRAIDWKTSARHTRLIAKEYRTERNNNIVMALDAGRAMCEPQAGVPRIDRAVSAALLTAYIALKDGDRVGLFSFDSRPRASTKPISGPRAFATLQRVAAGIDYSDHETNYTLGLATLAGSLARRSLIVVFTEFADTVSAELMLEAVAPLLKRHLVLFVVLRDEELEAFTAAAPDLPGDVSRAVTAAGLLRERRLVLTKLRHIGVHVVETPAAEAGPALVNAYLDLKRRALL